MSIQLLSAEELAEPLRLLRQDGKVCIEIKDGKDAADALAQSLVIHLGVPLIIAKEVRPDVWEFSTMKKAT